MEFPQKEILHESAKCFAVFLTRLFFYISLPSLFFPHFSPFHQANYFTLTPSHHLTILKNFSTQTNPFFLNSCGFL